MLNPNEYFYDGKIRHFTLGMGKCIFINVEGFCKVWKIKIDVNHRQAVC